MSDIGHIVGTVEAARVRVATGDTDTVVDALKQILHASMSRRIGELPVRTVQESADNADTHARHAAEGAVSAYELLASLGESAALEPLRTEAIALGGDAETVAAHTAQISLELDELRELLAAATQKAFALERLAQLALNGQAAYAVGRQNVLGQVDEYKTGLTGSL